MYMFSVYSVTAVGRLF